MKNPIGIPQGPADFVGQIRFDPMLEVFKQQAFAANAFSPVLYAEKCELAPFLHPPQKRTCEAHLAKQTFFLGAIPFQSSGGSAFIFRTSVEPLTMTLCGVTSSRRFAPVARKHQREMI